MRLYSYLKINAGLTKSEVNELNREKRITVNGILCPLQKQISDTDIIRIDGRLIDKTAFIYYFYYKPKGILSTIKNCENSYINQISVPQKVTPAGRLDKESEGLMVLSNDGKFLNLLSAPGTHTKEYIVTLKDKITPEFIENLKKSYLLDNRETTPFEVIIMDDFNVDLTLKEGIYHEIRRVVKLSGNYVINLKRIRIAGFFLKDMKPGDLIELDVASIKNGIESV